jgi:uncharacterized protein YneR
MSEERKLLSATEAKVGLYPKYSLGASILKGVTGFFLGVVPRYFTSKAIDSWSKSGFFKTLKEGTEIDQGDIKDILEKKIKLVELTLTNQNFFFLYEKGFMSKKQKLIVLPLEHAKTASSHKGKSVTIGYDVPQEGKDKPQHFDVILEVKDSDNWAKTINDVIRGNI